MKKDNKIAGMEIAGQLAFHHVQISAASPTSVNFDQDFIVGRLEEPGRQ